MRAESRGEEMARIASRSAAARTRVWPLLSSRVRITSACCSTRPCPCPCRCSAQSETSNPCLCLRLVSCVPSGRSALDCAIRSIYPRDPRVLFARRFAPLLLVLLVCSSFVLSSASACLFCLLTCTFSDFISSAAGTGQAVITLLATRAIRGQRVVSESTRCVAFRGLQSAEPNSPSSCTHAVNSVARRCSLLVSASCCAAAGARVVAASSEQFNM